MNVTIKRGFPQPKRHAIQKRYKAKTVVLVDFDGVVSNTTAANAYISNKIMNIMKDVTGMKDDENVRLLNSKLYERHGHTWLGLHRLGYDITLQAFNEYLYGNVAEYAGISMTQNEMLAMCGFMMQSQAMGVDVMLYSNADTRWLKNFLHWDPCLYAVQDFVMSKGLVLKPTSESYTKTQEFLTKHGYQNVYFIDDKLSNILASPTHWQGIWMTPNVPVGNVHMSEHVHVCTSLRTAATTMLKGAS